MKNIARHLRQTLSFVLVLSMLFTSVPIQAFAAEAPVPRISVSAPLEQPEPVDYEAQQQAADESADASASTPDSLSLIHISNDISVLLQNTILRTLDFAMPD